MGRHFWADGVTRMVDERFKKMDTLKKLTKKQKVEYDKLTSKEKKIYDVVMLSFSTTSHESALDAARQGGIKFHFYPK
jgi:hypothetical protein